MNWQKVYALSQALVATFSCQQPNPLGRASFATSPSLTRGLLIRHFAIAGEPSIFGVNPNYSKATMTMEVTKALAALRPLYGKGNIEIVTEDGHRVRGVVRSMKTTQALTTPSVKVERADGEIVKIPFPAIVEIINHNQSGRAA